MLLPQMDDSSLKTSKADTRKYRYQSVITEEAVVDDSAMLDGCINLELIPTEYWAHVLNDETGLEMVLLLNAISTNKTDFFGKMITSLF